MNVRNIAVVVAAVAGLVACTTHEVITVQAENEPGTRDLPLGAKCKADEQCVAGLSCKVFMTDIQADVCQPDVRVCTATCSTDAVCKGFDEARGRCIGGCNDELVCALVEYRKATRQTEDLPIGALCEATTECSEGLKCLKGAGPTETCAEKTTCTISCKTDEECGELDESAKCFEGCNGKTICMLTAKK